MDDTTSESYQAEMEALVHLFFDQVAQLGQLKATSAQALPPLYRTLLAHHDHMTVTLEAFHQSLVDVHTVAERAEPTSYTRQSLLTRQSDSATVQYGIMRIELAGLPQQVRSDIESHAAPLGRILIRHNLLRKVELLALWEVKVGERLAALLDLEIGQTIYGRSAAIHLAGEPAVDLLEIVTIPAE